MTIDLTAAFQYCDANGIPVPLDLQLRARRVGAIKAQADMGGINRTYHDAITGALVRYFEGGIVTGPRNTFRQAATEAFYDAFYLGWKDGGGAFPIDKKALDWLTTRINEEYGHIDMLFENAKELRKDVEFDFFSWITARADGYTATLMAIYNAGVLMAKGGKMLTWQLGKTKEHCTTCSELNGQTHRASWYVSRNYIPQMPGADMECGGYRCMCKLLDDKGNVVTL